ncbi:MAG: hypothetical protein SXA11_14635 [Cyanobacteriota bacterium]|nr:hypothetical protein [Cyanobacteriota bacterium]
MVDRKKYSTYDEIAANLLKEIQPGIRVAVIGSQSFHSHISRSICEAAGRELANIENLVLLTGGVSGIGETLGRSFWMTRKNQGRSPLVYHILPEGSEPWDYGLTLFGGFSMSDRRSLLARMASLYVLMEGGPGAEQETHRAIANGGRIIPVGSTGGFAGKLYQSVRCPPNIDPQIWNLLGSEETSAPEVAGAIAGIVKIIFPEAV